MDEHEALHPNLEETPEAESRLPDSLEIAEIISNEHECSYIAGRPANLPLTLPMRQLTLDEFDFVLDQGLRRSGVFLYHTACSNCVECQPSRVDVHRFHWSKSMQRVLKRGEHLRIESNLPTIDDVRLRLFNQHRLQRGLGTQDHSYGSDDYESFLVDSCCCQSIELSYWIDDTMIAVSIIDCGRNSFSAVYTYFDPAYSALSLGTFSILKQFEFAITTGRQYVYLGMYVAQNQHLNYKSRFVPQERWIEGKWVAFDTRTP